MQGLATSARHAFAATATNQHWRTPYVHVPMCGGNKGACGAALARGQGGAAALPLSPSASVCPFVGPPTKKHAKNRCASRNNLARGNNLRSWQATWGRGTALLLSVLTNDFGRRCRYRCDMAHERLPDTPATHQPAARARARGSMVSALTGLLARTGPTSAQHISTRRLTPPRCHLRAQATRLPRQQRCRCAVCRAHRYPPRAPPNRAQSPSTAVASYH
eukprot:scaffold110111_cov55-Phaeocystis_antarctica.AAC.1